MRLKIRKQKTIESCLSVCLMTLLEYQKGIKLKGDEEYNILCEGLKFFRLDFSTGHLVYLAKKFPSIVFEQYVDFEDFYKILRKLKVPKNVRILHQKINLRFLKKIVQDSPVIVYIDLFHIDKKSHHSPHFVILSEVGETSSTIFDPWSGEKVCIETKELMKSIRYLRDVLWISPKVIRIK